jgi:photosystem II stability/assembly factor-like uncharacterized protein
MSDVLFSVLLVLVLSLVGCGHHEDPRFTPQIEGASFNGPDSAWLTIKSGELLRTTDGGNSWQRAKTGETGFVQVTFIDPKLGYSVDISGGVWRSVDSGETWVMIGKIEPPEDTVVGKPQQMHFFDERKGWIVDSFSVWCTEDGGRKWTRCFPTNENERALAQPLRSFQVTQQVAWIAATNGRVYRTQDGRRSWQEKLLAQTTDFRDVYFIDESTGWLAGEPNGGIYKTQDGGETWNVVLKQASGNNIGVQSIYFLNKNDGWAVGRAYPEDVTREPTHGVVLRTTDGGDHWQPINFNHGELFYTQVHFVNAQVGWLVGQKDLYRTNDAGKTWSAVLKTPTR